MRALLLEPPTEGQVPEHEAIGWAFACLDETGEMLRSLGGALVDGAKDGRRGLIVSIWRMRRGVDEFGVAGVWLEASLGSVAAMMSGFGGLARGWFAEGERGAERLFHRARKTFQKTAKIQEDLRGEFRCWFSMWRSFERKLKRGGVHMMRNMLTVDDVIGKPEYTVGFLGPMNDPKGPWSDMYQKSAEVRLRQGPGARRSVGGVGLLDTRATVEEGGRVGHMELSSPAQGNSALGYEMNYDTGENAVRWVLELFGPVHQAYLPGYEVEPPWRWSPNWWGSQASDDNSFMREWLQFDIGGYRRPPWWESDDRVVTGPQYHVFEARRVEITPGVERWVVMNAPKGGSWVAVWTGYGAGGQVVRQYRGANVAADAAFSWDALGVGEPALPSRGYETEGERPWWDGLGSSGPEVREWEPGGAWTEHEAWTRVGAMEEAMR